MQGAELTGGSVATRGGGKAEELVRGRTTMSATYGAVWLVLVLEKHEDEGAGPPGLLGTARGGGWPQ